MRLPIITLTIQHERDVVVARRRARQIAELLGFEPQEQTRVATAVSEIARNAFRYAGGGEIRFEIDGEMPPQSLLIRVSDRGPGIENLDRILRGTYRSETGMGMGITGARRLTEHFEITTSPMGTIVELGKLLPRHAPLITGHLLTELTDELARNAIDAPFDEIQRQNQDLLRALDELSQRQEELNRLNAELEDTNRGVMALYAELDEKAEHLRRADQLKSKFLSNMSHEFRTPLNSILALTRLLINRVDGDLTPEQIRQVSFIRKGAESLIELVNDLLDIAKVEAGKIEVHPDPFHVSELFGALRGMLRPLSLNESVNLVFERAGGIPTLLSDEGKVAQILRNLISNALKYTEQGEVRVSARYDAATDTVIFAVADSGIGIAPEHQESIFLEFTQIENRMQSRSKGTGLGLPLSKRLAELLGGTISLRSEPGVGSTFFLTLPRLYAGAEMEVRERLRMIVEGSTEEEGHSSRTKVLVIDDDEVSHYLVTQHLQAERFEIRGTLSAKDGIEQARRRPPDVILLDLVMPELSGRKALEVLRNDPATGGIPIVIFTSKMLEPEEREWIESRAHALLTKESLGQDLLESTLDALLRRSDSRPFTTD